MSGLDISQLSNDLTSFGKQSEKAKSNSEVSKDQFLQLLVTQLKNQDPLNPMENEDFAVNLAQFSQLEQLVSINDNLENKPQDSSGSSFSSLASYLGTEVVMNSSEVSVANGKGGRVAFNIPSDAQALTLELLDSKGEVVGSKDIGAFAQGRHSVDVSDMSVPNGAYTARLSGTTELGASIQAEGFAAGYVTGFVPGATQTLLLGDIEVSPEDIKEVRAVG